MRPPGTDSQWAIDSEESASGRRPGEVGQGVGTPGEHPGPRNQIDRTRLPTNRAGVDRRCHRNALLGADRWSAREGRCFSRSPRAMRAEMDRKPGGQLGGGGEPVEHPYRSEARPRRLGSSVWTGSSGLGCPRQRRDDRIPTGERSASHALSRGRRALRRTRTNR